MADHLLIAWLIICSAKECWVLLVSFMNFNLFKKNILFRTMETPMETLTIDGGGK
jgi:hypothetical protein